MGTLAEIGSKYADAVRFLVFFLDAVAVGTMFALWERVGRFMLPRNAVRVFALASVLFLITIGIEVGERLGQELKFRTVLGACALFLYNVGLIMLYQWYATPSGRRSRHQIVNEYAANELHEFARLAIALEQDPEHMGRYVEPTWLGRLFRRPCFKTRKGEEDEL